MKYVGLLTLKSTLDTYKTGGNIQAILKGARYYPPSQEYKFGLKVKFEERLLIKKD